MPQPRGIVPAEHAARVQAAVAALEQARVDRDAAIVGALKAGGSVREVAAVAGMSVSQVGVIGRAGGWPTVEQKQARQDKRDDLAAWHRSIEAASKHIGQ